MADGSYERRGPREAELARIKRLLAEAAKRKSPDGGVAAAAPAAGRVSCGDDGSPASV
ncbi:MAG: hypothetical protein K6F50_04740 [Kiritimatiellae bacterium]|nr:hypothetical protein [Kiritimatiellia bacterium]